VTGGALVALAVGTQFSDLVDKPLAWTFGVLPYGRTLAHSLLIVVPLAALVMFLGQHYGKSRFGVAFTIGMVLHIFSDGLYATVEGEFADLRYLLWPVYLAPGYDTEQSFIVHFANLSLSSAVTFEFVLVGAAAVLWWLDGRPGVALIRTTGKRWLGMLRPASE